MNYNYDLSNLKGATCHSDEWQVAPFSSKGSIGKLSVHL